MIPEGWERTTLGRVSKITSGGTPDRTKAEYWGGSVPWVTTGEIGNGPIVSTSEHITELGLKSSSAKLFPPGTLLMAMYGQGKTRGKIAQLKIEATTNQACAAILTKSAADAAFLFQNLTARYDEIRDLSNDGSQKNLSGGLLKALPILLPPPRERERIAEILSTWDRALETVEALIANARDQKAALMQALLTGRTRLPGFAEAWAPTTIGAICDQVTERAGPATDLPVLSCSKHDGFVESLKYFKKKVFGDDLTGYKVVRRGMIGFPTNHVEEGSIARQNIVEAGLVSPIYCVFRPRDVDGEFLIRLLKTDEFTQRFAAATNASVNRRGSLRWKEFSKLRFNLPPPDEQRAIAAVINDAQAKERALTAQRDALCEEKAALMQQLLTGKRRVKVARGEGE